MLQYEFLSIIKLEVNPKTQMYNNFQIINSEEYILQKNFTFP